MAGLLHRLRSVALFRQLGPGLVTGAADDDPSGIATYSQAGAQFGFDLLWTMVLTYPMMTALQLASAKIGRVTGAGLAANMDKVMPRPLVEALIALLFVANTINIGADIAAMGDAGEMVTGISGHALTVLFALVSLLLQLFLPYRRYSNFLKWLTLSLLAYVAVVVLVRLDWRAALTGLVVPRIDGRDAIVTIVALFGTTISPYLMFWQCAQEVEELANRDGQPLRDAPADAPPELARMRTDTFAGMAFSNIVALAVMVATAATLHASGTTTIGSAADAARALQPVAGRFATLLFSAGIVGTGLLAVPVLAGSVAYGVSEMRGWPAGLERRPRQAIGFYGVIGAATLLGIGIDWSPIEPIRALFWSAVINGVAAVPIMAATLVVASRQALMGGFVAGRAMKLFGWLATVSMAAAAAALVFVGQ